MLFPKCCYYLKVFQLIFPRTHLKLVLTTCFIYSMMQIYCFLRKPTFSFFIQYGPFMIFVILATMTMALALDGYQKWSLLMRELNDYSTSDHEVTTEVRIPVMADSKYMDLCFILELLFQLMVYVFCGHQILMNSREWIILANFIEDNYPILFFPFITFIIFVMVLGYASFLFTQAYIYVNFGVIKREVRILNQYVMDSFKNIRTEHEHRLVEENLKYIIKTHQNILAFHYDAQDKFMIFNVVIGIIVLLSTGFGAIVIVSPFFGTTQAIIIFTMVIAKQLYGYDLNQGYSDVSNQFQEILYNLDWYNWNPENRRLFLTLFSFSRREIYVGYFQIFRMNRETLKGVMKLMYTVLNVLYSMTLK